MEPPAPLTPAWQSYIDAAVAANVTAYAAEHCPAAAAAAATASDTLRLRIAAVFVIMLASSCGVLPPILFGSEGVIEGRLYMLLKCFAGGLVLSVGFVHSLSDSIADWEELQADPNFAGSWIAGQFRTGFPLPMAIAAGSVIVVFAIEQLVAAAFRRIAADAAAAEAAETAAELKAGAHAHAMAPALPAGPGDTHAHDPSRDVEAAKGAASSNVIAPAPEATAHHHDHDDRHHTHPHLHGHGALLIARQLRGRRLILAYVLEVGIVVHSVIIGVNLGVLTTDTAAVTSLLIAVSFHQLFEGLGLGAAFAQARMSLPKALLMAASFAITTPIGIAIGIGAASTYEGDPVRGTIVKMVFNAISAGILIHLALVDLLFEEFSKPELDAARHRAGRTREAMLAAVAAGCACMTLLAIWA